MKSYSTIQLAAGALAFSSMVVAQNPFEYCGSDCVSLVATMDPAATSENAYESICTNPTSLQQYSNCLRRKCGAEGGYEIYGLLFGQEFCKDSYGLDVIFPDPNPSIEPTPAATEGLTESETATEVPSSTGNSEEPSATGSASQTETEIEPTTAATTGISKVSSTVIETSTDAIPSFTKSATGSDAPEPADFTTSTVYATRIHTVTSCPPEVTKCLVGSAITETIAISTTVCLVTEKHTKPVEHHTKPAESGHWNNTAPCTTGIVTIPVVGTPAAACPTCVPSKPSGGNGGAAPSQVVVAMGASVSFSGFLATAGIVFALFM